MVFGMATRKGTVTLEEAQLDHALSDQRPRPVKKKRCPLFTDCSTPAFGAGVLSTAHGEVPTPAFMPVGTAATVKAMKPDGVRALLEVPATWSLVAYLCLGYPEEEHADPELERCGWQPRVDPTTFVIQR